VGARGENDGRMCATARIYRAEIFALCQKVKQFAPLKSETHLPLLKNKVRFIYESKFFTNSSVTFEYFAVSTCFISYRIFSYLRAPYTFYIPRRCLFPREGPRNDTGDDWSRRKLRASTIITQVSCEYRGARLSSDLSSPLSNRLTAALNLPTPKG